MRACRRILTLAAEKGETQMDRKGSMQSMHFCGVSEWGDQELSAMVVAQWD